MSGTGSVPAGILEELRRGEYGGVFIDETASPGLAVEHLPVGRKSWVAVIIPPSQIAEVMEQFPRAIQELLEVAGVDEFHFCPIYQGKKGTPLEAIPFPVRMALFQVMAYIFATYHFPVLVQTLWPANKTVEWFRQWMPKQLGPFDMHDSSDLALVLLLHRVKWFLRDEMNSQPVRLFIDETDRFKRGRRVALPRFSIAFVGSEIISAESGALQPIQLADFAAFALNRWQLLLGRAQLNCRDRQLLEVLTPVMQNYKNIPGLEVQADEWPPFAG